jgi:hypothetical protein
MTIANVCSFLHLPAKGPFQSKFSMLRLFFIIVLLTLTISLFFKGAVITIFPLSLIFLAISMQKLPSELKDKISSEF